MNAIFEQIEQINFNEAKIIRSEVLHHQYFHLNEEFDRTKETFKPRTTQRLREFGQNIKKVKKDMQDAWMYVPFDMPGDFQQVVPVPNTADSFISVQPVCRRDLESSKNEVIGRVKNPDASKEEKKMDKAEKQ